MNENITHIAIPYGDDISNCYIQRVKRNEVTEEEMSVIEIIIVEQYFEIEKLRREIKELQNE